MSALNSALVDIVVRDNFYARDPNEYTISPVRVFTKEFSEVVKLLNDRGFKDVYPPMPDFNGDFHNKMYSEYVEVRYGDIVTGTNYFDEEGDLVNEEEGCGYGLEFSEMKEIFEQVKALFDPTPIPILVSSWDKVEAIRVSHEEVIFSLAPDKYFEE